MEISIGKDRVLNVSHKLKKDELYKVKQSSNFESVTIMKKPQICKGFSSRTEDNQDILLLDYDFVAYNVVIDDISFLQKRYLVSPAYCFTTKERAEHGERVGNYHVVFLSKHNFVDIIEMLKHTHIDKNFIDLPLRTRYRSYVLRLSKKNNRGKPRFIETFLVWNALIKKRNEPEISTAHKIMLSKFYKRIIHPYYSNEDNLKIVRLQEYETLK